MLPCSPVSKSRKGLLNMDIRYRVYEYTFTREDLKRKRKREREKRRENIFELVFRIQPSRHTTVKSDHSRVYTLPSDSFSSVPMRNLFATVRKTCHPCGLPSPLLYSKIEVTIVRGRVIYRGISWPSLESGSCCSETIEISNLSLFLSLSLSHPLPYPRPTKRRELSRWLELSSPRLFDE